MVETELICWYGVKHFSDGLNHWVLAGFCSLVLPAVLAGFLAWMAHAAALSQDLLDSLTGAF
jgi:hypothetical protein